MFLIVTDWVQVKNHTVTLLHSFKWIKLQERTMSVSFAPLTKHQRRQLEDEKGFVWL